MIEHKPSQKKFGLHLAPMEGVTDFPMRKVLTQIPGIDQCTTEFLRITQSLYPDHVFTRICPELQSQSRTESGVPVFLQLLGSDPQMMGANAAKAVELGVIGIDLNFGCPAKTVNRHDGGASLLRSPDRLHFIVSNVRRMVPAHIPVTAKMRLGFDDTSLCLTNAMAISEAGASKITVHCRTKSDGYRPPAYWEWLPKIQEVISIPIVANGEIWNLQDYIQCKKVSGCREFMIGRGILRDPFLFHQIQRFEKGLSLGKTEQEAIEFATQGKQDAILDLVRSHLEICRELRGESYAIAKTKQWLKQVAFLNSDFNLLFEKIKIADSCETIRSTITEMNLAQQKSSESRFTSYI